jgi:prophage regulatory protein
MRAHPSIAGARPHWRDFLDASAPHGALLSWRKVEPRVGISRTTAWRLQQAGEFPSPYVISPGRVAYREQEIEAWRASRRPRTEQASAPPPGVARIDSAECPKPKSAGSPPRRRPVADRAAPQQILFDF